MDRGQDARLLRAVGRGWDWWHRLKRATPPPSLTSPEKQAYPTIVQTRVDLLSRSLEPLFSSLPENYQRPLKPKFSGSEF